MMTLNYNEKDFQKKLQKDIEMPEIVHEHINQARCYKIFQVLKAAVPCIFT